MKQPAWKRILSHLVELHIESAPSDINPHLYVSLSKGRYQLSTKQAIYSYGDLYDNFMLTFKALKWKKFNPETALLLGVGLGSIPYMLEKIFYEKLSYTGVEIDENVLYLAEKYVLSELESPMEMIVADAYRFLQNSDRSFDLLCMDVFLDDVIPDEMRTVDYLELLRDHLNTDGLLLYNCLTKSRSDAKQTRKFLDYEFLEVFPDGGYLDVRGNWMLVNNREMFR